MGESQKMGESAWDCVATGSLSPPNAHHVCGWRLLEAGKLRVIRVATSSALWSWIESFTRRIFRNRRVRKFFSRFTHLRIREFNGLWEVEILRVGAVICGDLLISC